MAIRKPTFPVITPIPVPDLLSPYVSAALLHPHSGTNLLATSVYMPQTVDRPTYSCILTWLAQTSLSFPDHLPVIGGDFQLNCHSPPKWAEALFSHFLPLSDPTPTFRHGLTSIDPWLTTAFGLSCITCHTTNTLRSDLSDHDSISVDLTLTDTHTIYTPIPPTLPPSRFRMPLTPTHLQTYKESTHAIPVSYTHLTLPTKA